MSARAVKARTSDGVPLNYRLNVVTFAIVREPGAPVQSRPRASSPEEVVALVRAGNLIPDDGKEHFIELLLDSQNGLITAHHVSTGSLSASIVHPREVLGPAIRLMGVAHLVLVHNHPSGEPTPSNEDIHLTRQLVEGAKLLGLRIHDHVIIGNGTDRFVSMAQRGAM